MKAISIGLMLGAAVLAGGCASQAPQPTSMRDPRADFSAYETFALKDGHSGDASSQPVSIVEGYIRAAITAELKGKGYVEAAAGTEPDLRIEYEAASEKKLKNNPFRIGVGTEGTLVIHAVDPVRKAEVWQGRASRELGKGDIEPAVVQAAVAELLHDFPARSGQP